MMPKRLTRSSIIYLGLALTLLTLGIVLKIYISSMTERSIEVSISDNSLVKLPLPLGSNNVQKLTIDGDFVSKGRLIASIKDEKGVIDYIFASQEGYFVENPTCCKQPIGEIYGYIVKKHQGKIIFFQPKELSEIKLKPGDKIAIRGEGYTTMGEIIIVMLNSYSPINSIYGIEFHREPNYKSLVNNQSLDLVKINSVQSIFKSIFKQVFMIRL